RGQRLVLRYGAPALGGAQRPADTRGAGGLGRRHRQSRPRGVDRDRRSERRGAHGGSVRAGPRSRRSRARRSRPVGERLRGALRRHRRLSMTTALRTSTPRAMLQRMSRCLVVSAGTTLLSAAILVALALGAGVPAGSANVIAVCCGIAPSYFANRHWVWGRSGRSDVVREIVPFWTLSLAGLGASTAAVSVAAS